jgi:hypothetical protein
LNATTTKTDPLLTAAPDYRAGRVHRKWPWPLQGTVLPLAGAHVLLAVLLVYSLAFATHFTFRFEPLAFMDHYRYLANGFAHHHIYGCDAQGRPLPVGCIDCLNYYGKVYYPYGPLPALFQLLLINLLGLRVTDGAIVWGVCAITLYAAFWIARWYAHNLLALTPQAATVAASAFVAVAGTTDIFLHTSTVPYSWSQACATGQLLNLLSAFLLIRAVHTGKPRGILWAGILCGLSFLSKQNYLPGFLAGCALLLWTASRARWSGRHMLTRLASFVIPVFLCAAMLLWYNFARFGSAIETGFQYLNASEKAPQPYQMPQVHRIPYNLYNHFVAGFTIRTSDFPFVMGNSSNFGGINTKDGSGGLLHNFPIFSVFVSMPMLLVLIPAFVYAVYLLVQKRLRTPWEYWLYLIALWVCLFAYFLNESGTFMRYQYDMPFLLGLCIMQVVIFSWRAMSRISQDQFRVFLRTSFAAFLVLSFGVQVLLGLDQTAGLLLSRTDRFILWQAAERPSDARLRERAQAIRSALFDRTPENTTAKNFKLEVTLPYHPARYTEPLLQLGDQGGHSDMLGLQYLPDGSIRLLFDHWGAPLCISEPFIPDAATQLIDLAFDPRSGRTSIKVNGRTAMNCATGVFAQGLNKAILGKNTIGFTTVGPAFSGSIHDVRLHPASTSTSR